MPTRAHTDRVERAHWVVSGLCSGGHFSQLGHPARSDTARKQVIQLSVVGIGRGGHQSRPALRTCLVESAGPGRHPRGRMPDRERDRCPLSEDGHTCRLGDICDHHHLPRPFQRLAGSCDVRHAMGGRSHQSGRVHGDHVADPCGLPINSKSVAQWVKRNLTRPPTRLCSCAFAGSCAPSTLLVSPSSMTRRGCQTPRSPSTSRPSLRPDMSP